MKYDGHGKVEWFKGQFTAQGYSQKYGLDYEETFAPISRLSSICTLLTYAIEQGLLVHQMDIVTAFLNGDLQQERSTWSILQIMLNPEKETLCLCKLNKSLYGLEQSP